MAKYSGTKSRLAAPGTVYNKRKKSFRLPKLGENAIDFFTGLFAYLKNKIMESRSAVMGMAAGLILAFILILIMDFNNVRKLANYAPDLTTKIYDKNNILISEFFRQKREVVPLNKMPKNLLNAFIAMEDNEFYDHFGINVKGIVRAFFINIFSGRIKQGGSTITQQVAKILLTSGQRNIYRKIKEAFIALMMEVTYSKKEILGMYLNQIFMGQGCYGVESAAQLYFDKHVWEMNLAECALLATLPAAPNRFTPMRYPKRAMFRHRIALAKMVEMGFIKPAHAEKAYLEFWPEYLRRISEMEPTMNAWTSRVNLAPWFTEYVRRKLVAKYGEDLVYDKGLQVYTTLDVKKQMAAQEVLKNALRGQTSVSAGLVFKNEDFIIDSYGDVLELIGDLYDLRPYTRKGSRENNKVSDYFLENVSEELDALNFIAGCDVMGNFLDLCKDKYFENRDFQKVEGCIISINHSNGYIETMVGGSEFTSINQLNRTMQARRQTGSAIKPLIYSAAIESRDFTAATMVLDSPVVYLDNEGGEWLPENYEGDYHGLVSLRKALALSINIVSIKIADKVGIDYLIKYFSKFFGFDKVTAGKRISRNYSIALGAIEVSPYELTRAYAIIANGGKDVLPFSIRNVRDRDGKILEDGEKEIQDEIERRKKNGTYQILKPETAQVMISLMTTVINGGTGSGAGINRPAAGKTGTTNSFKDAWFIGFVPQITTGVWVGYDKLGLSLGIGQSGGAIAAPVWGKYMREAMKNDAALDFPYYAGLSEFVVCGKSGLVPSSLCKDKIKEIFVPGTEPKKECARCSGKEDISIMTRKTPLENISRDQKRSIMRTIDREDENSVFDNIREDPLK